MELLPVAVSILRSQPYGFFVTTGEAGPTARLVQHLAVDEDGSVWFSTSPTSRKADDVARDPLAAYSVEDRSSFAYVTVRGRARLVFDYAERARLWDPGLEAFFPGGPHGDDVVLVHLVASAVELMSFAHGIHPDPYGLRAAVAAGSG